MAALTVDFRKHSGPTPADDIAAQIITDCGNFTLDFKQHGCCASTLPPDSGTLISKWNAKFTFTGKEDFGPLSNTPVLFLLSPGKILPVNFAFNKLWYSTPRTAPPFSNDPLWLTLFVEGVNDRLLVPLPSQQCSPLLWFQRTIDTQNLYCMDGHLLETQM